MSLGVDSRDGGIRANWGIHRGKNPILFSSRDPSFRLAPLPLPRNEFANAAGSLTVLQANTRRMDDAVGPG